MSKVLIIISLILSIGSNAQSVIQDSISPEIIKLCDKIGASSDIIGLGESTHGTKEFTLIRAEIVKNLIKNHNYKVFVLEAEYMICTEINAFVLTGNGSPESTLKKLPWPWAHKDFLELIYWIRNYNIQNPTDQVNFIGMDSQHSKVYATQDSIRSNYPVLSNSILEIIENRKKPKRKIKQLRKLSDQLFNQYSKVDLKLHYYIFCRINRIAYSEYQDLSARDENMAQLTHYIHEKYGDKTIIWAHNGHIWKKSPSFFETTPSGYYLNQYYGSNYKAIGLDFKSGSFNAVSYDEASKYERKVFLFKPIKNTLSMTISFQENELSILNCTDLKGKNYINAIGAIYVDEPLESHNFTSRITKNKEYDFIIFTHTSSPTNLMVD